MGMNHLYQEINDALYNTYYGINRIEEEELKKSRFKDLPIKEIHAIDAITMYDQLTTSQIAKRLEQPLEKFPINIDEYGNTAAASEAILLAECLVIDQMGEIKRYSSGEIIKVDIER